MNVADYLLSNVSDDATAVVDGTGRHTYGELKALVAAQSAALAGLPLGPSARVAVIAPNGLGWVGAYLAILASGLVAVPIPNTLTPDEIVARLQWIGVNASILGDRELRYLNGRVSHALPLVPPSWNSLDDRGPDFHHEVGPNADAVYAFTSGTTGVPRAVRLTHGNLQANTASILKYLPVEASDRVLVVLPFSYVFGASVLHTHLRAGATLVIHPNAVFPQSMVERMIAERCTGFAGVPSTFHVLLRNSTFGSQPLPDLRTIQQAGGKLAPALVRELVVAQPQAKVFVMYGQTEATARLSFLPPDDLERKLGSIGRGIPDVTLRVVTPEGVPVAAGEVGEIWARGSNISPGYLNDPEETERKMPDGELRTGDLATVDADGYIYIVDRKEDFIKSWGFRIASQDVESTVIQLTELVAVTVVGIPDEAAGERVELVAVKRPDASITAEDVLRHCRAHLAKQMVPARVRFVPRLPLNVNGKVSKALVRELCLRLERES